MEIRKFFNPAPEIDTSWQTARDLVATRLPINAAIIRLIKLGWESQISQEEFIKLIGGTRLNSGCLLQAAQIFADGRRPSYEHVVNAVNTLGLSYCSVVIAVNTLTRLLLKSKPPPIWQSFLKDMMSSIEVGSILGSKIPGFGESCGALMGFAEHAGQSILLMQNPKGFKEWRLQRAKGRSARAIELQTFGCELYQVSALVLQHLGFGIDVAVGSAVGIGDLHPEHLALGDSILCWKAAIAWIDALKKGRDMPAETRMREFFPAIAPSRAAGEKNLTLGVLYTQVAKVKGAGSNWTWHLPLPSYEATSGEWELS